MKKVSKAKAQRRQALLEKTKSRRLILTLCSIPPFAVTVAFIVLQIFRISFLWLSLLGAVLWYALGGLFIYSERERWGYVNENGIKTERSHSAVSIYNIVLVFVLGVLFTAFSIMKLI